jgi:hypothetical protein
MASRRSLEDAEAYELASLSSERSRSPSRSGAYPPKAEEGEEDDALLSDERRASDRKEGDDEDTGVGGGSRKVLDSDGDEIVGKGEGVEALIARVSRLSPSIARYRAGTEMCHRALAHAG